MKHWLVVLLIFSTSVFAQETELPFVMEEQMVTMRDGTKLVTQIFKPKTIKGTLPVVFTRTPYLTQIPWQHKASYFVKRGYVFVLQSIRGMHGSEGEYKLFSRMEASDAYDAIDWIAKQDFSDGNIGITGTSYDGFTSLAAGVFYHPNLRVIFSGGAPSNVEYHVFRKNGIILGTVLDYIRYNQTGQGPIFSPDFAQKLIQSNVNGKPLADYDEIIFGQDFSEWNLLVGEGRTDDFTYFYERSIYQELVNIRTPTYHIAGLRKDGDLVDTIYNFKKVDRESKYRNQHRLILGMWDHGNSTPYGEGNMSAFMKERFDALMAYYLKGTPTQYASEARVLMETNSGSFLAGDTFPLPNTKKTFYFSDEGLIETVDKNPLSSAYVFKPGTVVDEDQYITFTFKNPQELNVFGTVKFELFFNFDTPQMDFMAVIQKVNEEGEQVFITNCLLSSVVKKTGTVSKVELDYCPILNSIKKDETVLVIIFSNLFPTIFSNPNDETGTSYLPTNIELLHSQEYPSKMVFSLE